MQTKNFNYQNLDPGLALGRAYLFLFFLIFQWVVMLFLHGSEWGYDGFPTRIICRDGWQARVYVCKRVCCCWGLIVFFIGGGLVGLAWRGIFFFDTKSDWIELNVLLPTFGVVLVVDYDGALHGDISMLSVPGWCVTVVSRFVVQP